VAEAVGASRCVAEVAGWYRLAWPRVWRAAQDRGVQLAGRAGPRPCCWVSTRPASSGPAGGRRPRVGGCCRAAGQVDEAGLPRAQGLLAQVDALTAASAPTSSTGPPTSDRLPGPPPPGRSSPRSPGSGPASSNSARTTL